MRLGGVRIAGAFALLFLVNCDGCGDNEAPACTVKQSDAGVTFACGDDDVTIANPGSCSVEQAEDEVTVSCPDGSEVTIPIGGGSGGGDAGEACMVTANPDSSITITCPDGTMTTIPGTGGGDGGVGDAGADGGGDATLSPLVLYTGASATACGACHDTQENKNHYTTQTTTVAGLPVEGCPTCHSETGLVPVSTAHRRLELGSPGFRVEILDAGIDPTSRKVAVSIRLRDEAGAPVSRDAGVSLNYVIAHVPPQVSASDGAVTYAGPYTSYLSRTATQQDNTDYPLEGTPRVVQQPTGESNGTYVDQGPGLFDYNFRAVDGGGLPETYDPSHTHVVAVYATRTVGGVRFVSNATRNFVPNNPAATPMKRTIVQTATCNNCHNPLQAHGGSRQEVQLCLTCHSQGGLDPETDNTIDFNVMIHKIHMGADLPTVRAGGKYGIVGNSNSTHDYSEVEFPQPIVNCQSCHTASDDERWYTNGTQEVCMSCHENIFEPGVHEFPLTDPAAATCGNSFCHSPGGNGRDPQEAHITFLNDATARVFDIQILSAMVANADAAPALRVKALSGTRSTGATTPLTSVDQLATLNVFFNGPNREFALNGHNIKQYNKASLVNLAATTTPGEFTFSLPETLRQSAGTAGNVATDSYTLSIRAAWDPTPGGAADNVDMIKNPSIAIAAAGTAAVRTPVADTAKCNKCHGNLTAHGGDILARNVEECIMCHTSTLETSPRQSANKEAGPTSSLRFSKMVHRIHGHSVATEPYILYGFASMPPYPQVDFSSVAFPGDVRDCAACHLAGTNFLPLVVSPGPTQTLVLGLDGGVLPK